MGKARRPMYLLVAHRMADIYDDLRRRMAVLGIATRLESREDATLACAKYGTDVDGMNNRDVKPEDR